MHELMLREIVKRCRQREAEGDCPTEAAFSVEQLEDAVIELASRVETVLARSLSILDSEISGANDCLKLDLMPDARASADGWHNAATGIKIAVQKLTVFLPHPTPDQIEYLERMKALGVYDPATVIGGPKKST